MPRYIALSMGLLLGAMLLSGCSYDRSFMQMDSNSGVPFFGLQWAVDSGSRPSKSGADHDDHEMTPSLIDLRTPSTFDQFGGARMDLESERDEIQTVSLNRWTLAPLYRRSKTSAPRTSSTESAASGDIPIHAIMPNSRSSKAATMFQNQRSAF